ncbi:hypothetical protein [Nocardiopsis algeriensis]|uniref:Uncharacterized protein n=1 Tax=Nocardiopsis algeriensis TaxID=1478215 RepID=A0A841IN16_9ACTN|nr:hypothetical protein [Nocardiopsis algeriensis]MBB6119464.1 hypothetical protein [Nocardiopsis algeriensis]
MTTTPYEPSDSNDSDERSEADQGRTHDAVRELRARVIRPRPSDPASLDTPAQPPFAGTVPARNTHRTATSIRKVGVGILGLTGGLLIGLLARFIVPGDLPPTPALLLGAVTLALAVLGVVSALLTDHRFLVRRARTSPTEKP